MTKLRVLVVDDEPPARDRLVRLLRSDPEIEIAGQAGDGVAALAAIETLAPDLVFLDVQMPELDGLAVAAALRRDGPAVVFATAHDDHALRAFELAAVDYLLKPIAKERLFAAIERVRKARARVPAAEIARAVLERLGARGLDANAVPEAPRKMAIRCGTKYVVFDPSRVSAVLAQDHYATLLVDDKELLSEESLDRIFTRLDASRFLRVHRSAIVNLELVKELDVEGDRKYVAVLADKAGTRVPIARERLDEVKTRLGIGAPSAATRRT